MQACHLAWQSIEQVAGEIDALFQLLISRVAAVALIGLSEDTLDTIDDLEEVISLTANLSFNFFLHYAFVDNFQREVEVINDVVLHNEIEGHILVHFADLLGDPLVQCTYRIALEILRLDLADGKVDVLNRSAFVLLFFLHLLLRDLQSDDEARSLRGEYLVDVLEVQIFLRDSISLQANHQLPLLFNLIKQFIKGFHSFVDVGIPKWSKLA